MHCLANGDSFSLSDVLDGTIALLVGESTAPSWNIINDTGAVVTSLNLYYSGALAVNAFIDMQISGTSVFAACTATTATNVVTTSANCGSADKTTDNPSLALLLVWSGGTGLAINAEFNLKTASFAHSGADAGCFSGTSNCEQQVAVPEPASIALLGSGLFGMAMRYRRRRTA